MFGGLRQALLRNWTHSFPIGHRPFDVIGAELGVRASEVLRLYQALHAEGALARIGGEFAPRGLWCLAVAAEAAPAPFAVRPAGVTLHGTIEAPPGGRWFALAAPDGPALQARFDDLTGALGMPLTQLHGLRRDGSPPLPAPPPSPEEARLAELVQAGLPLVLQPYAPWSAALGMRNGEVLARLRAWLLDGRLRRFGTCLPEPPSTPSHAPWFGWPVPAAAAHDAAHALGAAAGVAAVRRCHPAPGWPCNLFARLAGTPALAADLAERVAARCGLPPPQQVWRAV